MIKPSAGRIDFLTAAGPGAITIASIGFHLDCHSRMYLCFPAT
jgi:hypothetical protein